jgi:hypothetical protein
MPSLVVKSLAVPAQQKKKMEQAALVLSHLSSKIVWKNPCRFSLHYSTTLLKSGWQCTSDP